MADVVFLNPKTCGIYKNGAPRYKIDPVSGSRTDRIDNELIELVDSYVKGESRPGVSKVPLDKIQRRKILVPMYFDKRYNDGVNALLRTLTVKGVTLGELMESKTIMIREGHGSPGNDQRNGNTPYVKVSDIRALRINVNPTNLIPLNLARQFWKGRESGLKAWDVLTPNRASSNIGEFAILLPGEEAIVLTKEVFIIRVLDDAIFDPFYFLWALSLRVVREQWRRIALMQTNREDCGERHKEIIVPMPPSREWAVEKSQAFRTYFTAIARAKERFLAAIANDKPQYIASVAALASPEDEVADQPDDVRG